MPGWDPLHSLVNQEIIQRTEEGCNTEGFNARVEEAGEDEVKLQGILEELSRLPVQADFPYNEPSELHEIRALRPPSIQIPSANLTELQWRDQFYGAWLGRSIGCALGKPLEAWDFMAGKNGIPGWKNVQLWFEGAGAWPITGYTPSTSTASETHGLRLAVVNMKSTQEHIRFMETDDDIRYTVLGLMMLEEKGLDWDSWDVGRLWHRWLSYYQVCTAETQAYVNFAQITTHVTTHLKDVRPENWKEKLQWVRSHHNPYREWIGAQIRADGFAYGAAGRPELAAELAWRDASFSHVKNGIYGEMFVAAMIAAAFVEKDPRKIVQIGLSQIPATSRLAADIHRAVEIAESAVDQVSLVEQIWEAFKHYNPVHTNNNAALVAAALIFGDGNFDKAVTTSVLGGWDTDCNGATVGSIMGASLGAAALPASWVAPLNDTLYAEISGFHPIAISECAERSYQVFKKLQA